MSTERISFWHLFELSAKEFYRHIYIYIKYEFFLLCLKRFFYNIPSLLEHFQILILDQLQHLDLYKPHLVSRDAYYV